MDLRQVDLRDMISLPEGFEFLRAEMPAKAYTPFVLIRYAVDGSEQKLGLRLDLHKSVFLDHFADSEIDAAVCRAAPVIVQILNSSRAPDR